MQKKVVILFSLLCIANVPLRSSKTFSKFRNVKIKNKFTPYKNIFMNNAFKYYSSPKAFPFFHSKTTFIPGTTSSPMVHNRSLIKESKQPKENSLVHIKSPQNNTSSNSSYWKKYLALITAALIGGTVAQMQDETPADDILAQEQFKDFRSFIMLTQDAELQKRWNMCKKDNQCSTIIQEANLITIIDREPYIVLKDHQFDRVINAKIAENVIEKNKLNLIAIAKKTILFDGKSWKVVAEKISGEIPTKLSLEQVQQLTTFAQETGYHDWKMENLVFDKKSGKLFIIDTEDRSFARAGYNKHNYVNTLLADLMWLKKEERRFRNLIDKPTQEWLNTQVKDLNAPEGIKKHSPLPSNLSLNRSFKKLNLKKVRAQAKQYADALHVVDKDKHGLREIKIVGDKNSLFF